MTPIEYDVIVVGAGISGINTAYRVQERLPGCSFAILEARSELGGTWSIFKYPGIRSDSDLFTFGFSWDPWEADNPIATAPSILSYLRRATAKTGLDKKIKYNHKVLSMNWSSDRQRWELEVQVAEAETQPFHCRFLAVGTGYYDYNQGLSATIPGLSNFKGQVVHPQFWPENLDYADKKVVIVGSGATAVTILPAMHEKAAHVTMLQRSPGYFISPPTTDSSVALAKKYLPASWATVLLRLKFLLWSYLFYYWCVFFPDSARRSLRGGVAEQLPSSLSLDPHFSPSYSPWKQRMCITPGGDFFAALRTGKADVVTGVIDTVTADGIRLKSAPDSILEADIIVSATGLKVQFLGHAVMTVDGTPVNLGEKFLWRGCMLQDVPNLFIFFGYVNASWTLGVDATARLMGRLIQRLRSRGISSVSAVMDGSSQQHQLQEVPMLGLTSGYVKAALDGGALPKCLSEGPWRPRTSYLYDSFFAKFGRFDGLVFGEGVKALKVQS